MPGRAAVEVTLAGRDENGEEVRYELEDLYARAAQHELDHLDGMLIIDRTTPEARREALACCGPASSSAEPMARIAVAATAPFGADVLERLAAAPRRSRCC